MDSLKDKVTILVNSCDAYEDLWFPFFTLLKKYWNPIEHDIILNTESKNYSFDGLPIRCVHQPQNCKGYGHRMIHALKQVRTPYVVPLMDDFFLREPVNVERLNKIIQWMESDKHIVCFNQEPTHVDREWDEKKYDGFHRLPIGTQYTLNMQAAVWRTKKLVSYWRKEVSPWEWELYCSFASIRYPWDKFYCVTNIDNSFCYYGHARCGDIWGVLQGKWVEDDIVPLFRREKIEIDLTQRGICKISDGWETMESVHDDPDYYLKLVERCLGRASLLKYKTFCLFSGIESRSKNSIWQYYGYMTAFSQKICYSLLRMAGKM